MRAVPLRLRLLLTLLVPLAVYAPVTVAIVYRAVGAAIAEQVDARGVALPQEKRIPACVLTCSSRALHWGVVATDLADGGKYGEAKTKLGTAPDIADPSYTDPNIRFSTKRW